MERNNIVFEGARYTLQGTGSETGINLTGRSNVTIKNMEIRSFEYGIWLYRSSNNSIFGNDITANKRNGINLWETSKNSISGNNITNNEFGIGLDRSSDNMLRNNNLSHNQYNFGVQGFTFSDYFQDIDASNIVDNKRLYYWINIQNQEVPIDAGCVALIGSRNVTVRGLDLKNNYQAVLLAYTNSSSITENNITNNEDGIYLFESSHNTLSGNDITNNGCGIKLVVSSNNSLAENNVANNEMGIGLALSSHNTLVGNNIAKNQYGIWTARSSNDKVYHNNLINNTNQVYSILSVNIWDDGYPSGGNYWSDYSAGYPNVRDEYHGENQDIPSDDGIWDHPYGIDADNIDNYPSVEPCTPLPRTIGELKTKVEKLGFEDQIDNQGIVTSLLAKLNVAQKLIDKLKIEKAETILANDFIPQIQNLSGIHITPEAADILIKSAEYIISHL